MLPVLLYYCIIFFLVPRPQKNPDQPDRVPSGKERARIHGRAVGVADLGAGKPHRNPGLVDRP